MKLITEDKEISRRNYIKYGSVYLDADLRMGVHVMKTTQKVKKVLAKVNIFVGNIGSPSEVKRRIFVSMM